MFDVEVPAKRRGKPPTVVKEDEEYKNVNPEKFKKLATVFQGQSVAFFFSNFHLVQIQESQNGAQNVEIIFLQRN